MVRKKCILACCVLLESNYMRRIAAILPILVPCAAVAQSGEESHPRIIVTSAATIPSPPDRAVVSFSVHGEGSTSDDAVRAVVTKREAIEKGLAGASGRLDIRAAQIGIAEVRGPDCNRNNYGNPRLSIGECAIIGYTADLARLRRQAGGYYQCLQPQL